MRSYAIATIVLGVFLSTIGCAAAGKDARNGLLIDAGQLQDRLGEDNLIIIHAAGDDETFREEHIPGARWADWNRLNREVHGVAMSMPPVDEIVDLVRELGITSDSDIVIYDEVGGLQAARLMVALEMVGLGDRISLLDGHLKGWKAFDGPLEDTPQEIEPSDFTPRSFNETLLVDHRSMRSLAWLARHAGDAAGAELTMIDARPPEEYRGDSPGTDVDRPGHIPGAVNVFWESHLRGDDDHRLRDRAELESLYREAGLEPGHTPLVYCRTGNQSSHTYFVLRYLGYEPRSYDGSFLQWHRDANAPVQR